jgi:hypothetical protein
MVSLFCVAYPHETVEVKSDPAAFIAGVRAEGRLLLDNPAKVEETIELSETRKGFLIKVSFVDHVGAVADQPLKTLDQVFTEHEAAIDAEKYRPVKGFANYEFSNKGNLRNVKTGNLVKRDGNRFKVSQDGQSASLSLGDLEAQY